MDSMTASLTQRITVETRGKGLYDITPQVAALVAEAGLTDGLCVVFIQHTSASLIIQENCDPAVCRDLEQWLNRLVPEEDTIYTHTEEGPDDMPAHVKCALTSTSLMIPVCGGRLALGRWQAIYLWEHRRRANSRSCLVQVRP